MWGHAGTWWQDADPFSLGDEVRWRLLHLSGGLYNVIFSPWEKERPPGTDPRLLVTFLFQSPIWGVETPLPLDGEYRGRVRSIDAISWQKSREEALSPYYVVPGTTVIEERTQLTGWEREPRDDGLSLIGFIVELALEKTSAGNGSRARFAAGTS